MSGLSILIDIISPIIFIVLIAFILYFIILKIKILYFVNSFATSFLFFSMPISVTLHQTILRMF